MRIVTVNIPLQDIRTINGLVGEKALYPSRSELIRVAVRDFLIKELKTAKFITPKSLKLANMEAEGVVNVPTDLHVGNTTIRGFKQYKIVDRAEKFKTQGIKENKNDENI